MRIEHIAMYVNDLEAARDFFIQYFGGRSNGGYHNPRTDFRSYFITFDDGARLELMNKPEMDDHQKASLAVQKRNYAVRMYKTVGFRTIEENTEEFIMVCDF